MNTNVFRSAGVAIGILVGLVIAVALVRFSNNDKKYRAQYDERQLKIRGDAYRYAFYTLLVWETISFLICLSELPLPFGYETLHVGGIFIGCLVLAAICIWKDAYWGLNSNRKRYGVIFVAGGLLNALPIFFALKGSHSAEEASFPWVNLMACLMLLISGAELLIKHLMDRREGRNES